MSESGSEIDVVTVSDTESELLKVLNSDNITVIRDSENDSDSCQSDGLNVSDAEIDFSSIIHKNKNKISVVQLDECQEDIDVESTSDSVALEHLRLLEHEDTQVDESSNSESENNENISESDCENLSVFRGFSPTAHPSEKFFQLESLIKNTLEEQKPYLVPIKRHQITRKDNCCFCEKRFYLQRRHQYFKWEFCSKCRQWMCPVCARQSKCFCKLN